VTFHLCQRNFNGGEGLAPCEFDGDLNTAHAYDVLPYDVSVHLAANVTQMSEPGKIQLQSAVAMDEIGHTIFYKLHRGSNFYDECRRRGISTFTLIRLAFATTFTGVASKAVRVNGTDPTRVAKEAGRNQNRLMHSINRYQ
jgi:hypothetical protein